MANAMYTKAKQKFLEAGIDIDTNNIKVTLTDSADYTLAIATDDFYNDVTAAGRVAESGNLASKTVTDGVFDAADVTYSTVSGDQSEYLVLYEDSGVETTSPLIVNFDTATGLPVTPNGGDITITWDSGANKIFAFT